jgi:hypothetical protein
MIGAMSADEIIADKFVGERSRGRRDRTWRNKSADSDEAARANRHDAARDSEMMSPGIPG